MENLENRIKDLNEKYRLGKPEVSDIEYDRLLDELKSVNPKSDIFKTGVIEAPPVSRKQKLPIPMYSLDKCKSVSELKSWLEKISTDNDIVVITPKYNGVSLVVDNINNKAWTRGDGEYGQDISEHFLSVQTRGYVFDIEYGEAIISKENWGNYFKGEVSNNGLPYKLNHSTVSGMLNDDKITDNLKYIDFIKYGCNEIDIDKSSQLTKMNFSCIYTKFTKICVKDINEELIDSLYQKWSKDYPIDGLVIDINDYNKRKILGRQKNMNPAYSRALKLDKWTEEAQTRIIGYEFNISKQGKLKGTITISPVTIDGTEINQVSFYNAKFLFDFCLNRGVNITIKKGGDIIPKIVAVEGVRIPLKENFDSAKKFEESLECAKSEILSIILKKESKLHPYFIYNCPICGSKLFWDKNAVELVCNNKDCDGLRLSKLEHFFTTMGVEEFGRPSIKILYKRGFDTIYKIMNITFEELSSIEGFGEASARIVLNQFNMIRGKRTLYSKFFYALDLFEGKLGEKACQAIFDNVNMEEEFGVKDLIGVPGVSDITSNAFILGIDNYKLSDGDSLPLEKMFDLHMYPTKEKIVGDKFKDQKVCFSGVRDADLEFKIISQGGEIVSGVSKKTTLLIVSDLSIETYKMLKARELGIEVNSINNYKN